MLYGRVAELLAVLLPTPPSMAVSRLALFDSPRQSEIRHYVVIVRVYGSHSPVEIVSGRWSRRNALSRLHERSFDVRGGLDDE